MPNELGEMKCFLFTIAKFETDEDFLLHHYHIQEFVHHISGAMLPWIKDRQNYLVVYFNGTFAIYFFSVHLRIY
jgi:hypothetical protein